MGKGIGRKQIFPFVSLFYQHLRDAYLGEVNGKKIPLYCCAGICFAPERSRFHTVFMMARECCDSAKAAAKQEKNLREGLAGNWIDFMICDRDRFQKLDLLKNNSYVTETNLNLMLRPYCLNDAAKDKEYAYEKFLERVSILHRLKLRYGQIRLNRLREHFLMGELEFRNGLYWLKKQGIDLEALLGSPFYRDEKGNLYAAWYDALEAMQVIGKEPENVGNTD